MSDYEEDLMNRASEVLDDVLVRVSDAIADGQESMVMNVSEVKLLHGLASQALALSQRPPESLALPIDLLTPLMRDPRFSEFWVFADDALASRSANPVVFYKEGIACAMLSGRHDARAMGEAIAKARRLKGDGWRSLGATFGILVGEEIGARDDRRLVARKILVLSWAEGRWKPYSDGLVTWLKETLLAIVHQRDAAPDPFGGVAGR